MEKHAGEIRVERRRKKEEKIIVKILKKTDIVLIAALLIFAVMFYFIFGLSSAGGETVVIKVNGKVYGEISLNKDGDIGIYPDGVTLTNTLRIKNKKAVMVYANCPDRLCMLHKPVGTDSYDMIVCLPNKITVEIRKDGKVKDEFDAVIKT